jgi:hypothetical protein
LRLLKRKRRSESSSGRRGERRERRDRLEARVVRFSFSAFTRSTALYGHYGSSRALRKDSADVDGRFTVLVLSPFFHLFILHLVTFSRYPPTNDPKQCYDRSFDVIPLPSKLHARIICLSVLLDVLFLRPAKATLSTKTGFTDAAASPVFFSSTYLRHCAVLSGQPPQSGC